MVSLQGACATDERGSQASSAEETGRGWEGGPRRGDTCWHLPHLEPEPEPGTVGGHVGKHQAAD